MKQLTCEMCGSTDIAKQDGFFVCQTCGCKYSVEEAKKMMIEGTVDVQGTVKIDHSDKIDNYYTLAENAYDSHNFQEAETYCNKIIELDATNYKAWFLKGKAVGWQSTLKEVRIEESIMCFSKALQLVSNNCESDNADNIKDDLKSEAIEEFDELINALLNVCFEQFSKYPDETHRERLMLNLNRSSKYANLMRSELDLDETFNRLDLHLAYELGNAAVKGFLNVNNEYVQRTPQNIYLEHFNSARKSFDMCIELQQIAILMFEQKNNAIKEENQKVLKEFVDDREALNTFTDLFKENDQQHVDMYIGMCEHIIECYKIYNLLCYPDRVAGVVRYLSNDEKKANLVKIKHYYEEIQKIKPDYKIPEESKNEESKNIATESSGGCYVATCVYGSYDCPQVWTLRRYRDDTLGATWYGRLFIRTYYAISPTLVKWFGNTNWFKKMWKGKLDRMVDKLQSKGVENTPYEDKTW